MKQTKIIEGDEVILALPNFKTMRKTIGDEAYRGYLIGSLYEFGLAADNGDSVSKKLFFIYEREFMKFLYGRDV